MLSYDKKKSYQFLYYNCIKTCKEMKKCVAISFRESTNDCWLKSSNGSVPRRWRSFMTLQCLDQPNSILYPGYKHEVRVTLGKTIPSKCPEGFEDMVPSSENCYNLVHRTKASWNSAQFICRKYYHGAEVVKVESAALHAAYTKRLRDCKECDVKKIWMGWIRGTLR